MGWADLLSAPEERTLPWLGGRSVYGLQRRWRLIGPQPPEHGWHRFEINGGKRVRWLSEDFAAMDFEQGRTLVRGYLVGDRLIPDTAAVRLDVHAVFAQTEPVFLVEPGLERFSRALVARNGDGRLVFIRQEFPEGPEQDVLEAWQDRLDDVDHIPGVTPALQLAFLWLTWQRMLSEERQETRAQEQAWQQALRDLERQRHSFNSTTRRSIVTHDFTTAARAALAVSGAELLDHQQDYNGDQIVQFRFMHRRFECVVHPQTLRIVEAGICLTDHASGERGDERFTLESLPSVIKEAIDTNVLHIFRHV